VRNPLRTNLPVYQNFHHLLWHGVLQFLSPCPITRQFFPVSSLTFPSYSLSRSSSWAIPMGLISNVCSHL
jgi:hypothetical protein